ncbi:MAG TPA: RsmD family RNA methyltransferase [Pirellulales bacterium]|nr:RsmD family RNA methyltransferase [Pirellulales bacterium]
MSRKSSGKRQSVGPPTAGFVRIIGGVLRGRRLEYPGDPRTRPMKDRVREAVFNLLGDVEGMTAVDLFAGTGALGFEALSRGAIGAVFVEQHFPTADAIGKNAALLGLADRCQVVPADTLVWFRRPSRLPELTGDRPWLVFCSPPYELFVSRRDDVLHLLQQLWQAAPRGSAFVVEADDRFDFSLLPQPERWLARSYPPAHVALAWKEAHQPGEP